MAPSSRRSRCATASSSRSRASPGSASRRPTSSPDCTRCAFSTSPCRSRSPSRTIDPRYSLADAEELVDEANVHDVGADRREGGRSHGHARRADAAVVPRRLGEPRTGSSIGLNPVAHERGARRASSPSATRRTAERVDLDRRRRAHGPCPGHPGAECCAPTAPRGAVRGPAGAAGDPVDLPMKEMPPAMSTEQLEALGLQGGGVVASRRATRPASRESRTSIGWRTSFEARSSVRVRRLLDQRARREAHRRERLRRGPGDQRRAPEPTRSVAGSPSSPPRCSTPRSSRVSTTGSTRATALYISRYPYGREATLGCPGARPADPQHHALRHLDLAVVHELVPHGHAVLDEVLRERRPDDQTTGTSGVCTSVRTERTRVYLDGTRRSTSCERATARAKASTATAPGRATTTTTSSTTVVAETTVPPTTVAPPPTESRRCRRCRRPRRSRRRCSCLRQFRRSRRRRPTVSQASVDVLTTAAAPSDDQAVQRRAHVERARTEQSE